MKIVDDRTEEQTQTHTALIVGTDRFMSGWGKAAGGVSYAVWACTPENAEKVFNWVDGRDEMKRVREVSDPYQPKGTGHTHIYVVNPGHPSIS